MDYTSLIKELNIPELVNALRICSGFVENPSCSECDYSLSVKCRRDMMHDAAAAIEALQKRLVNALTALHLANEKMGYYGIQPYTEADGEDMISDWVKTLVHEELEQQLPKRGEWIIVDEWKNTLGDKLMKIKCPFCNQQIKLYEQPMPKYCDSCGAKMEVQDGDD